MIFKKYYSIQFIIPVTILCTLILSGIYYFYDEKLYLFTELENNTLKNITHDLHLLQSNINDLFRKEDYEAIQKSVVNVSAESNINRIFLVDENSTVRFTSNFGLKDKKIDEILDFEIIKLIQEIKDDQLGKVFLNDNRDEIIGIYPVFIGKYENEIRPNKMGVIYLEYDLKYPKSLTENYLQKKLWSKILNNFVVMILCWLFLYFILTKKVLNIVKSAKKISSGDYSLNLNVEGFSETKEISTAFNNILKKISLDRNELIFEKEKLKEALGSLKISEERFRNLIQKIPFPIVLVNISGVITFRNDRFIKILGYSEDDVQTLKQWWDNAYPDEQYRQWVINTWENAIKQAEKENKDIESTEYKIICKNGEKRIFEISGIILKDGILVTFIDLTERKKVEEEINKLSVGIEQSPVSIIITNRNGNIEYVNPKFCRITGYSKNEVISKNPRILKSNKMSPKFYQNLWETILSGKEWHGEFQNRKKSGDFYWESASISPLKNSNDEITHFIAIKEDITDRKQNEIALHESNIRLEQTLTELQETQKMVQQQERMRALGQLASGIAHDINNSLSPILGYSDLLLSNEKIVSLAEKPLQMIKKASIDIRTTLSRMKEFYRPRIEQDEFNLQDLNKIILSAIDLTRHKWKDMAESEGKVIKIETQLQDNLFLIQCNESEIREALTNLIINAADALQKDGNIILKSFSFNKNVIIEIIDDGIGMDEFTLNHCLDPFFTTKGEKGTGLGLSMVFGIMERHHGKIKIESLKGKGTIIILTFPESSQIENLLPDIKQTLLSPLKVLYIDDDKNLREMLSTLLLKNNHRIVLAEDGKSGLEIFFEAEKEDPFNIVITDLGMPYIDGSSVAKSIKNKYPNTPVILLTGWGSFIEEGSIKNVDYILKKPVTIEELNKALNTVMKIK